MQWKRAGHTCSGAVLSATAALKPCTAAGRCLAPATESWPASTGRAVQRLPLLVCRPAGALLLLLQLLCKMPSCQVHLVALVQLQVCLKLLLLLCTERELQAQSAWSLWQCGADCAQRVLGWQPCLLCSAAGLLMLRRLPLILHPLCTALPTRLFPVLACWV